jgi:hypothetical protein
LLLTIYGLACFRLTRLVVTDDIGAPIHEWLRVRAFHQSPTELRTLNRPLAFVYKAISCAWCASIWIAGVIVVFSFTGVWWQYVCAGLALSSVAGVIHEATDGR